MFGGMGTVISLVAAAEERKRNMSPEERERRVRQAQDAHARQTGKGIGTFLSPVVLEKKPGRNDPCLCGSGKKTKKCHPTE